MGGDHLSSVANVFLYHWEEFIETVIWGEEFTSRGAFLLAFVTANCYVGCRLFLRFLFWVHDTYFVAGGGRIVAFAPFHSKVQFSYAPNF